MRIWENVGNPETTDKILFKNPGTNNVTCWILSGICSIRSSQLTSTRCTLMSQFLILISPIPSHLTFSCSQLYHFVRTCRYVIPLNLSMPWTWVDTKYSINPRLTVFHSQLVTHLSSLFSYLSSLISHLSSPISHLSSLLSYPSAFIS